MGFKSSAKFQSTSKLPRKYLVFNKNKLLLKNSAFLADSDLKVLGLDPMSSIYIGTDNINDYFVKEILDDTSSGEFRSDILRNLYPELSSDHMAISNYAFQILHWDKNSRFCGVCGYPLRPKPEEHAKYCEKCNFSSYPHVCPVAITLVTRDHDMLLAKNAPRKAVFYSTLAGFVSPGESLEECVQREIFEEVGIKIKNIKYFGSQSWPFPNNIMVAFTAEYDSGEIHIDPKEIADAQWFSPNNLPPLPPTISVARQMIDTHLKKYGAIK